MSTLSLFIKVTLVSDQDHVYSQRHHSTLDGHLKDLKSELSKVFTAVLSTDVSAENFNETFNKLSVAVTGRGSGKRPFDGISTKLKRHLKQARIDTVAL